MNRCTLPPKRWQEDSPEWDSLRHLPWYNALLVRKKQIPALKQAYLLTLKGVPQWKAAAEFQVDERELRDYQKYQAGMPLGITLGEQRAILAAYAMYCDSALKHPFHYCVERSAEYHGLNPRALREKWEIDPCVYPNGYQT
jgi:hypothetical protein